MPINFRFFSSCFVVILLLQSILLSSCGGSGFHLRKSIDLPKIYQEVELVGLPGESNFARVFETALEEAGGKLQKDAGVKVSISNLREGKRVVAYTGERKARIYLVFLKFEYTIQKQRKKILTQRINLDRTFIYDANFALGKAEEEKQIREGLNEEAARLIILRLQYSNGTLLHE